MDKTIQIMMDDVIKEEIGNLSAIPTGSEEYQSAVEGLKKLYELKIEESKAEQAKADKRVDRWINVGLQASLTIATLIAYDIWFRRGLRFEETGTIRAPMTRNLLGRMLPGKK